MISCVLAILGTPANATGNALNRRASLDEPAQVQIDPAPRVLGSAANGGAVLVLYLAARAHPGPVSQAARLGVAAGFRYGLTAAFTKGMAHQFNEGGISAVFAPWELYACVAAGLVSVWWLQNACEAGPLTASQPGITLVDPIISTLWGVVVFGEHVTHRTYRTQLALTPLPLIAGVAGVMVLSRPPGLRATQAGQGRALEGRRPDLTGADS